MARIEAQLATQAADIVRPVQTVRDGQLQGQAARQRAQSPPQDVSVMPLEEDVKPDEVRAAAAQLKQVIETASGKKLDFAVDDTGKYLLFKVMSDKGEVLRQIPSKEVLDLHRRIEDLVGMLVDQTA